MTQLTPLSAPQANNCHTFRLSNPKQPTNLLMASSPEPALNQRQFSPTVTVKQTQASHVLTFDPAIFSYGTMTEEICFFPQKSLKLSRKHRLVYLHCSLSEQHRVGLSMLVSLLLRQNS